MARDYQTKSNVGALPDTITATRFGAGEFNSIAVELENAVTTSDQTLAPSDGTGEVTNQLAMAMAIYGAGGGFYYADTGAVNAYALSPISPKESPPAYFDGFTVIFEPGTPNTTASTVNVNSLGVKDITYSDGNSLAGGELSGSCGIKYNLSDDRFELLFSSGSLAGVGLVYVADSTQSDQGATSANADTNTIYDIATLVGTSKNATIYLPHNPVAGNTTPYVFDTSLDLSSYPNIKFKIDNGAVFTRTTGDETFTIYSPEKLFIGRKQQITSVDMLLFYRPGTVLVGWWGAVADNTTDCTNAIQYAINAISNAARGRVFAPSGVYLMGSGVTIATDNIIVEGDGMNSTVFTRSTDFSHLFAFDKTNDYINYCYCRNFGVSVGTSTLQTSGSTIYFVAGVGCGIQNVRITGGCFLGIELDGVNQFIIDGCNVRLSGTYAAGRAALHMQRRSGSYPGTPGNCAAVEINNCIFDTSYLPGNAQDYMQYGIYCEAMDGLMVTNTRIGGAHTANVCLNASDSGANMSHFMFQGCFLDLTPGRNFLTQGTSALTFENLHVTGCHMGGGSESIYSFDFQGNIEDVTISGGHIGQIGDSAVNITGSVSGLVIDGTRIKNYNLNNTSKEGVLFAAGWTGEDVSIVNCRFTPSNSGDGIQINAGTLIDISHNIFKDCDYGVIVASGVTVFQISNNIFDGSVTSDIDDSSGVVTKNIAENSGSW